MRCSCVDCLKLVSVYNFHCEVFRQAASATGAWIITDGLQDGLATRVGEAFGQQERRQHASGQRTRLVGIADWRLVRMREELINKDETVKKATTSRQRKSPL